jgi:chemotaxis protein methyltransferase CheR
MSRGDVEQQEIELVIHTIATFRGYDFGQYARASLRRRLQKAMTRCNIARFSELIPRIIHDDEFFSDLLLDLSVTVTEMFRDAHFYRAFRERVVPTLRTYPLIKLWHAGCATGEEPYSMAIVLHEEGLLDRAQIYATDINDRSLTLAQRGLYRLADMEAYAEGYARAGGQGALSDHYRAMYASAMMAEPLRERILFSNHNLVSDAAFGEMHAVICRNVLIYFERPLQDRALALFRDTLVHRGFLCLGDKETTRLSEVKDDFDLVAEPKIYRRRATLGGAP